MRATHVIAGLDPAHGGPSYSVPSLCRAMTRRGAAVSLLSVESEGAPVAGVVDRRFAQTGAGLPMLGAIKASTGLARALREEAARADVLHAHGLWLMPNVYPAWAAKRTNKPFVLSPRGMLAPAALQFSRGRKMMFWRLLQQPAVHSAACLHATAHSEREDIRAFGLTNPVAVIPNGVDLPAFDATRAEPATRTVLSLGRIHPKKGLDRLVAAWARVAPAHPDWRLRIIGPDEDGHADELRVLADREAAPRLTIEAPLEGAEKLAAYRDADLFVLSTLNENFGMTVAEALAAEVPVISTKGAPWAGLEQQGCGWWIDHGVEPLAAAIGRAMALPREELRAMGERGRAWMARDYSWDRVAADMLEVYRWLSKGGERPPCVRLD